MKVVSLLSVSRKEYKASKEKSSRFSGKTDLNLESPYQDVEINSILGK